MSVALIFPPLVSSGFGSYYPAMAVLSGALKAAGHTVQQIDLNEELAEYLLEPERLNNMGNGRFFEGDTRVSQAGEMPAVAARILAKNRDVLFASDGRHKFSEHDKTPAFLLPVLTQPYVHDAPVSETLDALEGPQELVAWYQAFLDTMNLPQEIDPATGLIGISVPMGPQLLPAFVLARHLRRLFPATRIVLGGPTMSLMQDNALDAVLARCDFIDAIVRYDGEGPLLRLAEQVSEAVWQPEKVPGVSCLGSGGPVHRPPAPGPKLDELPIADYDPALTARLSDPELGVVQTRGCYWGRCAYCDFVELYDGSPRYRGRSPESFVDEVSTQIARHGVRRFSLITEAIPPSFSLRFSKLVLERELDIAWSSFAMVDNHFSKKHFETMAASGCDHLVIGLETMTDRVLKNVHKYGTGDDNEAFLKQASGAGISLYVNLIPNLPTTTYDEAMQSLERLARIEHTLGGIAIFPFEATRSSQIGRTPEAYGLQVVENGNSDGQAVFADNHLSIVDPGMTPEELTKVLGAYQNFADSVNARTGRRFAPARADTMQLAQVEPAALTVADRDVDMQLADNEIRFFNWKTRERWVAPRGLKPILDRARALDGAFTSQELIGGAVNRKELAFLVDLMVSKGIFAPTGEQRAVQ